MIMKDMQALLSLELLSLIIIAVVVETHYVTLAGQEFTTIILVLTLECQDYGSMPSC